MIPCIWLVEGAKTKGDTWRVFHLWGFLFLALSIIHFINYGLIKVSVCKIINYGLINISLLLCILLQFIISFRHRVIC